MGKSLINLPQTLEELEEMLKSIENENRERKEKILDKEEKLLEDYLNENFNPLDIINNEILTAE